MWALCRGSFDMDYAEFECSTLRQIRHLTRWQEMRDLREDGRSGQWMALYANCHRDSEKRPEPYNASDFYPLLPAPKPERVTRKRGGNRQQQEQARMFAALTGQTFADFAAQSAAADG